MARSSTATPSSRRWKRVTWPDLFAGEEIEDDHLILEDGEIVSGTYKAIYEASES